MKSLLAIYVFFVVFSCQSEVGDRVLSPDEFEASMAAHPGIILDVRSSEEFERGHLINALNMDIHQSSFEAQLTKMDKSAIYYLYCKKGGRSNDAFQLLKANGFQNVYDLEGGLKSWQKEGKPITKGTASVETEITPKEYEKMISSFPLVLIDFSATWCGPCKKLTPMLEKMGQNRAKDFKVQMIDVDDNPTIAQENGIEALPTLLWYKNGKLVKRVLGYHNEKEINQMIDDLIK